MAQQKHSPSFFAHSPTNSQGQACNYGGGPGGLDHCSFPQKGESALFLLIGSTFNHY